jgi:iron complex outermembrane recepter protein
MSIHSFSLCRSLIWVLLGASLSARAQVSGESTKSDAQSAKVSEVVVTSGKPKEGEQAQRQGTQTLSGTELVLQRESTFGETLKLLPGVSASGFGPNASRPIVRGLEGERVHILQNGSSNFDLSALSPDHAVVIDPLSIEKVELLRGPAALLYGQAVDGVINVQDARITSQSLFKGVGPGRLGAQGKADWSVGGAAQENNRAMQVQTGNSRFGLHADAFVRSAENTRVNAVKSCTQNGVTTLTHQICNSDAQARGQAVGGSLFFDRGYLGASWSDALSNYGTVAEDEVRIEMRQLRRNLQGEFRPATGALQSVRAQWSQGDYAHTEFDAGQPGTVFNNQGLSWRVDAVQRSSGTALGEWAGSLGLQMDQKNMRILGSEAFAPFSDSATQAIFAHQSLTQAGSVWSLGLRVETAQTESLGNPSVTRFSPGLRRHQPWSLALGHEKTLSHGWQSTSHLAFVQRAPKDHELFADGPHLATAAYVIGNPDLPAERFASLNMGAKWSDSANGRHKLGLNAYLNDYANYIALQATGFNNDTENNAGVRTGASAVDCGGNDAGKSVASGCTATIMREYAYQGVRARTMGLGLNGNVDLNALQSSQLGSAHSLEPRNLFDLEWRADWLEARNLSTGEALPRTPPLTLMSQLVWSRQSWTARFGFDHYAAQRAVPTGDVAVPGYTLWNAQVQYKARVADTQVLAYLKLTNLTDELAYSATSVLTQTVPGKAPLAGRGARLGLQWVF